MSKLVFGEYEYEMLDDGTYKAILTCSDTDVVVFPSDNQGVSVTEFGISKDAIVKTKIKKVVIPGTARTLWSISGDLSEGIEQLVIKDGVEEIGACAFSYCENLKEVLLPDSLLTIDVYAFEDCQSLQKINIPHKLYRLGREAFSGCESLFEIHLPASVRCIEDSVFSYCNNLTKITVDEENAFFQSVEGSLLSKDGKKFLRYAPGKKETNFNIPDSVEEIGPYAFSECTNLRTIVIPDSVARIGEGAFWNCPDLEIGNIPSNAIVANENVFDRIKIDGNIAFNTPDKFVVIYERCGCARTIKPSAIGTHKNGWTVEGCIKDDWVRWVNDFSAVKGDMWVKGNFETKVMASSKEALLEFLHYFPYEVWDYADI